MSKFKIRIGNPAEQQSIAISVRQHIELVPLPPNPDFELDYCWVCQRHKDVFWDGKILICVDCNKRKPVARKMKVQIVDEGLAIDEFLQRIHNRVEVYGE